MRYKWMGCVAALAVCMWLWGVLGTRGQETPLGDDSTLDQLTASTGNFFQDVSVGRIKEAYETLLKGSELAARQEQLDSLISKTEQLEERFGKCWNFEQIDARRIGTDVLVLTYLYKCDKLPVVWHITYYRTFERGNSLPASQYWTVVGIRFDTEIDAVPR